MLAWISEDGRLDYSGYQAAPALRPRLSIRRCPLADPLGCRLVLAAPLLGVMLDLANVGISVAWWHFCFFFLLGLGTARAYP